MEVFYHIDFDFMLMMKYDFEMPRDVQEDDLEAHRCIKKWQKVYMANSKAEYHILSVLLPNEINQIGSFQSINDLWDKLVELDEGTSATKLVKRTFWEARSII